VEYARTHASRSRDYESKAKIIREALGNRPASEITPKEIEAWLTARCKSPATANRYRAFLSLGYRLALQNGMVNSNPARLVRQRREPSGRLRYLTRDEYARLCDVLATKYPQHLAEFILSVQTGMRLSEQYSTTWSQVHLERRAIELTKTKNGSARTVHLNSDAIAALRSVMPSRPRASQRVFPSTRKAFDTRFWFLPALAEAKIPNYVWHCNRHTFCSWLAMAGATTREIMEAAGHKTITMAARYTHLSPDHSLAVVERISSASRAATGIHYSTATKTTTGQERPLDLSGQSSS
jgi:integrase